MTRFDYSHPFQREHLLFRTWPFLLTMVLAWLLVPLTNDPRDTSLLAYALTINIALVVAVIVLPWRRMRFGASGPAFTWLLVVALLRHGTEGAGSGFAPLMMLTVLWAAMYGSRSALALTVVGCFATLAIPALVGSPELYPDREFRRAILFGMVGGLVGIAVRETVAGLKEERAGRRRAEAQLTRQRAFELNDDVVQDLAVAKLSLEVGHTAEGLAALDRALEAGKRIISDMVEETGRFERRGPDHTEA